ncbi:MAG: YccF domain-containing protein [Bacteroidales bacterium]|nr:YccF domain-containing protein [Bacteroidales bacterium]
MRLLGNLVWLIMGGLTVALIYFVVGLVMCVTIIGIPCGLQLFKLGLFSLWPFGHEMVFGPNKPGCVSLGFNIIWILTGWWELALVHGLFGILLCITIVGIPWGLQHFKMAKYSLFPFGLTIQ